MVASRLIGLTGTIGSGKSTVGEILAARGIPVINADAIALEVTSKGGAVHDAVLKEFGTTERRQLRDVVFSDAVKRARLEAILHPAIRKRSKELAESHFAKGAKLVVYEAALLLETGRQNDLDGLLVITAPAEKQLARLLARDPSLTPELVKKILAAQMAGEEKAKLADWVIVNEGSREELKLKVEAWLKTVAAR